MRKYQYISFWRVIACIGVFIVHLGQRMQLEGSLRVVTDFGSNGVVIFFILTGFLALNSEEIYENKILYWKKRAVKILPLYVGILLFYFLIRLGQTHNLRNGIEFVMRENIGGTWTLHTFILFYLVIPFIVNIVNSYKRAWLLWFATFAMRCILIEFNCGSAFSPLRHLCFCAMGVVLFYAIKEEKEHSMIEIALIILILWLRLFPDDSFLIYSMVFLVMIYFSKGISIKRRAIGKVIDLIDKYSYEVYLLQGVVCYLFIDGRQMNKILVFVNMTIGTIVTVVVAYWMIEKPCKKIFRVGEKMGS